MKRVVLLLVSSTALLLIASCGSSGTSTTGPNGNVTVNAPSHLTNRAFITNSYNGNIQIVDSQNDTTAYYTATNNNTGNTTPGGSPASAVAIQLGGTSTLIALRPDDAETVVFQPTLNVLNFITNSDETSSGTVTLAGSTSSLVYSPDSTMLYAAVPTALVQNPGTPVTYGRPGAVQFITEATSTTGITLTNSVPVPSAQTVAITPDGKTLLVFAANSDTMYIITNLTAAAPTTVAITGFARPVNAFFSSDSTTAYVLNCGPECGSTSGSPSVMQFNLSSQTITATVPVGGATVGLLKGTILYVAGYPGGSTGTFDVVDVSAMSRTTVNPVAIGDGTHTTMAISNNNKIYIGAASCANQSVGCLSIVDLGKVSLDTVSNPLGAVTGLQSIPGRNVMYVVEGGYLFIYDTTTGQMQSTQIAFRGALYGVVQVDP
ncbi:MAG TPA: hypothetical protein VE779_06105 [Candidatus Angelobacter sp.]|nr:hypothetical protein [Candidatus Angelobacter sp.]